MSEYVVTKTGSAYHDALFPCFRNREAVRAIDNLFDTAEEAEEAGYHACPLCVTNK